MLLSIWILYVLVSFIIITIIIFFFLHCQMVLHNIDFEHFYITSFLFFCKNSLLFNIIIFFFLWLKYSLGKKDGFNCCLLANHVNYCHPFVLMDRVFDDGAWGQWRSQDFDSPWAESRSTNKSRVKFHVRGKCWVVAPIFFFWRYFVNSYQLRFGVNFMCKQIE